MTGRKTSPVTGASDGNLLHTATRARFQTTSTSLASAVIGNETRDSLA